MDLRDTNGKMGEHGCAFLKGGWRLQFFFYKGGGVPSNIFIWKMSKISYDTFLKILSVSSLFIFEISFLLYNKI
jgi:hypothetical protein